MRYFFALFISTLLYGNLLVGVGGYDCCKKNGVYHVYDGNCTINSNITDYLTKNLQNVHAVSIWITKDFDFKHWFSPQSINHNLINKGFTPIFILYWYRDDISRGYVKKTETEYFNFLKKFNNYLNNIKGKKYIILNPEYNQNRVENWKEFNYYLLKSYSLLKKKDRELGIGIGDFGIYNTTFDVNNWQTFNNSLEIAIRKFDFISFQEMRATSRNSEYDIKNTPYRSLELARYLYKKYKKPTFLAYLAISSYQSSSQDFVFKRFAQLMPLFKKEAKLIGFNIFHLWDTPQQVGYFLKNEQYFGILTKDGKKKKSFFWFKKIK